MEIAGFYGITAPKAVLLKMSPALAMSSVKILNNPQKVKDFLSELDYLEKFLNENLDWQPANVETRRLKAQYTKSMSYWSNNSEMKTGIIPKEELDSVRQTIANCDKIILNRIKYKGEVITVSPEEQKILQTLYNPSGIKRLRTLIVPSNSSHRELFGYNIYKITKMSGYKFKDIIAEILKSTSKNFMDNTFETCRNNIDILKEYINVEDKSLVRTLSLPGGLTDVELMEIMPHNIIPSSDFEFFKKLYSFGFTSINLSVLDTLYKMYNLVKEINLDFYNFSFGLDLTQDQYEVIFDNLAQYGLVGLDFYTEEIFFHMVSSSHLSPETVNAINNSDLISGIREVDSLLNSHRKFGEVIG